MSITASLKSEAAQLALSRFGLGARPGDLKAAIVDPRGYVMRQLAKPKLALLSDPALPSTDVIFRHQRYQEEMLRRAREANAQATANAQVCLPMRHRRLPI